MEDLGSDSIRDLLSESDQEDDDFDIVARTSVIVNNFNENFNDPIFDSESEGEFELNEDVHRLSESESEDGFDTSRQPQASLEVGLPRTEASSTVSSPASSLRPISSTSTTDDRSVGNRPHPNRPTIPQNRARARPTQNRARPTQNTARPTQNRQRKRKTPPTDEELGWSNIDIQPPLPTFNENSGIKAAIDSNSTPFDVFSLFFPVHLVALFKTETNRYAKSIIDKLRRSNQLKANSIWAKWTTVKLHEVYQFFSIILHMCVVKKFKIRDYWSTEKLISTSYASSIMSRDRFASILANFHIGDNSTAVRYEQPGHDPLHKIRPYINHLLSEFPRSYYPHQNLTVDEGTCAFRGRVRFRTYNKNKPDKYGIKLYIVCDSYTGYALNMEVYTGKTQDSSIVTLYGRLLSEYLGKGHVIYMDRFYSSPAVFDYLWQNNTQAVGTCVANRKQLPKTVIKTKLETGEVTFMRRDHLLCLKWKDKRDVLSLSTVHKMGMSEVSVKARGGPVKKFKPDVIIDYNKNKTGVDRNDQIIAYYPFKRKQIKWWKKLFFHLFMMSLANSFILYKESRPQNQRKKCHLYPYLVSIGKALGERGGEAAQEEASERPTNRLTGNNKTLSFYNIFLLLASTK